MALHGVFTSLSSDRICGSSLPIWRTKRPFCNRVRAVADKKDNLDHLRRLSNRTQPQQLQSKRPPQVAQTVLWDRFPTARTVQQMMDTMERIIEDPFAFSGSSWPSSSERMGDGYGRGRTPWAIREREGDYKMRFDMPGMTKNDVKVWVEENMLVVKAEKGTKERETQQSVNGNVEEEKEEEEEEEEWPDKSYGKYSFRIALPEKIEFEKIKAEVKDGVLGITVPKASSSSRVLDIYVQ